MCRFIGQMSIACYVLLNCMPLNAGESDAKPAKPSSAVKVETDAPQQILLHFKAIEAPSADLEKAGINLAHMSAVLSQAKAAAALKSLEAGPHKILAEPTVAAVSGRPAYFHVGGEVPVHTRGEPKAFLVGGENAGSAASPDAAQQYRRFGTEINFCPKVISGNKVQLDVRFSQTNLEPSLGSHDSINILLALDTRVTVPLGQTVILGGADAAAPAPAADPYGAKPSRNKVILLVRPELADSGN